MQEPRCTSLQQKVAAICRHRLGPASWVLLRSSQHAQSTQLATAVYRQPETAKRLSYSVL